LLNIQGEWINEERCGVGTKTSVDGTVENLVWKDDDFVVVEGRKVLTSAKITPINESSTFQGAGRGAKSAEQIKYHRGRLNYSFSGRERSQKGRRNA
jgi:hypothetical protein